MDNISFNIQTGEDPGSGGRSRVRQDNWGRCIKRVLNPTQREVWYHPPQGEAVDLVKLQRRELNPFRQEIRMIFQDPFASLKPRLTVRKSWVSASGSIST